MEKNSEADFWIQVYLISEVCFYHYCTLLWTYVVKSVHLIKNEFIFCWEDERIQLICKSNISFIFKRVFSPCNKNQRSPHLGIYIPVRRQILNHIQVSRLQYIRSSVLWQKRKRSWTSGELREWRWGEITLLSGVIWVDLTEKLTPEQRLRDGGSTLKLFHSLVHLEFYWTQNNVGGHFRSSP